MIDRRAQGDSKPIFIDELILASSSPRRRELMKELGIPFRIEPSDVDEIFDRSWSPRDTAIILAERKALAVAERIEKGIVLGADTVVAINDETIGKPADRAHAERILARLSGTRQAVITGVCLVDAYTGKKVSDAETTWVTMKEMTEQEIAEYVASGESDGKAGAYAIQDTGDRYVEKIEGPMDNVVGLPLELVRRLLIDISEK